MASKALSTSIRAITARTIQDGSPQMLSPVPVHIAPRDVHTTLYSFPDMEPLEYTSYPVEYLSLPLRRDILHRAVVFEGDATRQGTASTKWRGDVAGSGKKIRAQKGSGRARLGDRKSPMLRGGGVAHGPHPRDFSTELPRKIYDLAWRTALSYRYKRGEVIILRDIADLPRTDSILLKEIMETNGWGHTYGRSLFITDVRRNNLHDSMQDIGEHGKVLTKDDVDVKNLLETGRLIVENQALKNIFLEHQSDIAKPMSRLSRQASVAETAV
ncbi:ribosomal protein L4 [Patellaria atrata CBS 101060]|uniref:Large ribosomal subunit protein uL4m n=1 Tax=Patellaria atrata CBS 101060 TaxID=1346257 RepID=A0A9P4S0Z8_9PEZI|nr:ribosomal protein L4 [Patellaria atrata CBS 101060]